MKTSEIALTKETANVITFTAFNRGEGVITEMLRDELKMVVTICDSGKRKLQQNVHQIAAENFQVLVDTFAKGVGTGWVTMVLA